MLKPLSNRVLVKVTEQEQKTASGIYLPDAAEEKIQTALVVAVGEGKTTESGNTITMSVKKNDTVIFSKYSGIEYGEYIILSEDEILAILE